MNTKSKSITLILFGTLNFLHGIFHIIQFIQSMILFVYSTSHNVDDHSKENWLDSLLHSPYLAFIWAIIGIATMIIGIRDYRHHIKCKH